MAKYHITEKGNPGVCRAEKQCPFGGEDAHYATARQAHEAYQAKMQEQQVSKPAKKAIKTTSRREKLLLEYTNLEQEQKQLIKDMAALNKQMRHLQLKKKFHEGELEETRALYRQAKTPEEKQRLKDVALNVQGHLSPVVSELKPLQEQLDSKSLRAVQVNKKLATLAQTIEKEGLARPNVKKPVRNAHTRNTIKNQALQIAEKANSKESIVSVEENAVEKYTSITFTSAAPASKAYQELERHGYMVTWVGEHTMRVRPSSDFEVIHDSKDFTFTNGEFIAEISSLPHQRMPQFLRSAKTGNIVEMGAPEEFRDGENDITHWVLKPLDKRQQWTVTIFND